MGRLEVSYFVDKGLGRYICVMREFSDQFPCLVDTFSLQKKGKKNRLYFLDRDAFDFLWE